MNDQEFYQTFTQYFKDNFNLLPIAKYFQLGNTRNTLNLNTGLNYYPLKDVLRSVKTTPLNPDFQDIYAPLYTQQVNHLYVESRGTLIIHLNQGFTVQYLTNINIQSITSKVCSSGTLTKDTLNYDYLNGLVSAIENGSSSSQGMVGQLDLHNYPDIRVAYQELLLFLNNWIRINPYFHNAFYGATPYKDVNMIKTISLTQELF